MKDTIIATLDDLVQAFLYDDRQEDEDLPVGAIDAAVRDGIISVDEIVARFREQLVAGLGGDQEEG